MPNYVITINEIHELAVLVYKIKKAQTFSNQTRHYYNITHVARHCPDLPVWRWAREAMPVIDW